jgi:hypothetical protein
MNTRAFQFFSHIFFTLSVERSEPFHLVCAHQLRHTYNFEGTTMTLRLRLWFAIAD